MEIQKTYPLAIPVTEAISRLQDPEALRKALPGEAKVTTLTATEAAFSVEKTLARFKVTLKMKGTATYRPAPAGDALTIIADAGNLLSGKIRLQLDIAGEETAEERSLGLRATIEGSGLAGRLVRENPEATEARLDATIRRFLSDLSA